jgi:hypothetical protein
MRGDEVSLRRGRKGLRAKGHKLTLEWSGERARWERSSTAYCICGWQESASTQEECRHEYRCHLETVIADRVRQADEKIGDEPTGWFLEHHRYDDSCRWGPFATPEEARKWALDRDLSAAIIPLYMNVNWDRRG